MVGSFVKTCYLFINFVLSDHHVANFFSNGITVHVRCLFFGSVTMFSILFTLIGLSKI
jgi:hypothetical protein